MFYITYHETPLGKVLLTSTGTALTGLYFKTQPTEFDAHTEKPVLHDNLPVFLQTKKWLDMYFKGQNPAPDVIPLEPRGNTFRQSVWYLLRQIPYGEVTTYGTLAKKIAIKIGRPMSARAVGGAVGHNPISVIIPCHRVIGAGNNLTGYTGGLEIKIKLLKTEGVDLSNMSLPRIR